MNLRAPALATAALFVGLGVLLTACPKGAPTPKGPVSADSSASSGASSTASSGAPETSSSPSSTSTASPEPTATGSWKMSAGAVKSPVFSTDPCNGDADCLPLATCHPRECVGAANAGTMPKGMLCTMDCRGGTLDCGFNHCGCVASPSGGKRCAMLPGGKS